MFKLYEEIDVVIQEIDKEKRRVAVSFRLTQENPYDVFAKRFPVDAVCDSEVISKNEYALFVKVDESLKDNKGSEALNHDGLMQRAIKSIKNSVPEMIIISDVALDPYSSYGHDGIVKDGKILNDKTIEILSNMALSHAKCGADIIAPSDMMDGRILAIRKILEKNKFHDTGIMSYSAKYASALYAPFRNALDS